MKHHTTGDFNYIYGTWSLDPTRYQSAPSSIRFWRPITWYAQGALLKHSVSGAIEQGRLVSWFITDWLGATRRNLFIFRNTSPDGSALLTNSYALQFSQTYVKWVWYTSPELFVVVHDFVPMPANWILASVWYQIRVSWWNGKNLLNEDATVLRVEKFDGEWKQLLTDAYDTNQRNKGQGIQRAGIGIHTPEAGVQNWWDDTEFWKP